MPSSSARYVLLLNHNLPATSSHLIMAFFAGASNVTIYGGNFVNNEGKLTLNDSSRNTTNVNSNNKSTSNVIGSHNDNSTSISEQFDGFTLKGRLMICCKVAVLERCHRYLLDPQVCRYLCIIRVRQKTFNLSRRLQTRRLHSASASTPTIPSTNSFYWWYFHQSRLLQWGEHKC